MMKKRLIEQDLSLTEISEESAKQKDIRHDRPFTLHFWWTQQPAVAR